MRAPGCPARIGTSQDDSSLELLRCSAARRARACTLTHHGPPARSAGRSSSVRGTPVHETLALARHVSHSDMLDGDGGGAPGEQSTVHLISSVPIRLAADEPQPRAHKTLKAKRHSGAASRPVQSPPQQPFAFGVEPGAAVPAGLRPPPADDVAIDPMDEAGATTAAQGTCGASNSAILSLRLTARAGPEGSGLQRGVSNALEALLRVS
jgi:hypothetical protein